MHPLDKLYQQWSDKYPDYDGYYGAQCWDLAMYYNQMFGGPRWWGDAKDIYNQPGSVYVQIPNTASAVPQKGDVVVWGAMPGNPYGHVGIATGEGDTNRFNSFDVNWPTGSPAHVVNHNYNNVIGWLRPRTLIAKPEQPQVKEEGMAILTNDQKKQLYNTYLGRDPEDYGQITEIDFLRSAGAEIAVIRNQQQQNVKDLQSRVMQLEKVVADAKALLDKQTNELENAGALRKNLEKDLGELNKKLDALQTGSTRTGLDGYTFTQLLTAIVDKVVAKLKK